MCPGSSRKGCGEGSGVCEAEVGSVEPGVYAEQGQGGGLGGPGVGGRGEVGDGERLKERAADSDSQVSSGLLAWGF